MTDILHPGLNLGENHGEAHIRSEVSVFGFWVFLMSDLITFGILLATYMASHTTFGMAGGPTPTQTFNLASVGIQTMLLLSSSLTCGMAGLALKYHEDIRRIMLWLGVTAVLGVSFLVFELSDFASMISKGATPMRSSWLSSLYALVGLHGLHILVGIIWIISMMVLLVRQGLDHQIKTRLLIFMLYWHFLDLIWIGIFSVVFLGGVA